MPNIAATQSIAPHASSHATGSSDALTAAQIGAAAKTGTSVADANVGVLTLLTDAITAIGVLQAKLNATLAALRASGIIQ